MGGRSERKKIRWTVHLLLVRVSACKQTMANHRLSSHPASVHHHIHRQHLSETAWNTISYTWNTTPHLEHTILNDLHGRLLWIVIYLRFGVRYERVSYFIEYSIHQRCFYPATLWAQQVLVSAATAIFYLRALECAALTIDRVSMGITSVIVRGNRGSGGKSWITKFGWKFAGFSIPQ